MSLIKFNINTEVRKALKGKPTKVSVESLFHIVAPYYLEAVRDAKAEAGEQTDIAELERMFRL
jgi:hypothetical protein